MRIATPVISIRVLDIAAAKRYLRDVRSLCDEGVTTSDVRVIQLALRIVAKQEAAIDALHERWTATPPV